MRKLTLIITGPDQLTARMWRELLLSLGSPRRDCKQSAKEAIKRFKTLRGVLEASAEELQEIEGIGPHNAFGIKLVREVAQQFLKEKIIDRPIYSSAQQVFDYLYASMRGLKKEVFKKTWSQYPYLSQE